MARVPGPSLDALMSRAETFTDRLVSGLRSTTEQVSEQLSDEPSVDDISDFVRVWTEHVDDEMIPHLQGIWTESADTVRERLQSEAERVDSELTQVAAALVAAPVEIPSVRDILAELYLQTRRNFLIGIGDYTWELARSELLEGMQEGEGVTDLRDRLMQSVDFARPRANAVARTEVVGASNAGAYQQMIDAGLPATKEWVATDDARTRPTHNEADGETTQLTSTFTVGGSPMDRPHDPNGPPDEVVNCRCTVIFDVDDDALVTD